MAESAECTAGAVANFETQCQGTGEFCVPSNSSQPQTLEIHRSFPWFSMILSQFVDASRGNRGSESWSVVVLNHPIFGRTSSDFTPQFLNELASISYIATEDVHTGSEFSHGKIMIFQFAILT